MLASPVNEQSTLILQLHDNLRRHTADIESMKLLRHLIAVVCILLAQATYAQNLDLTPPEAAKRGIRVELVTPKPKIVQATLHFTNLPPDVSLVIRDAKDGFIAVASLAMSAKSCSATLSEDYVGRSYFLISTKPGEPSLQIPLR